MAGPPMVTRSELLSAEHDDLLSIDKSKDPVLRPRPKRILVTIVGVAVGLASVAILFLKVPRVEGTGALLGQHGLHLEPKEELTDWVDETVGLFEDRSACEALPSLRFEKILYSNLNNKGPHSGKGEGYVIQAQKLGSSNIERLDGDMVGLGRKVIIVINSTNNKYIPADPAVNKMTGAYAGLSLQRNDELAFQMTFFDSEYRKLVMPQFVITFFDLDADYFMQNAEGIEIGGFKQKFLADGHYLNVTNLSNGMTRFAATQVGQGEDNPKNYLALAPLQRKRAVTLLFDNVSEIAGRMTTGDGHRLGFRQFFFLAMPTVLCARTANASDTDYANFPPLPKEDLFYNPPREMPVIDYAFPQYFKEWKKNLGDRVREGDVIATVTVDGVTRELKSPANGNITDRHDLVAGDRVDLKLAQMVIAVVSQDPAIPIGA